MQIFVGDTAYEVDAAQSVAALKLQIENKEFVPAGQIRLVHGATLLQEDDLLADLQDDDELVMSLEVSAGMRKKWKKKRMRRLRRKRRRMRQRAR